MLDAKEQINLLLDFGTVVAQERDLDKLLMIMADFAKTLLEADRCSIFLLDENRSELYSTIAHGTNEIRFPVAKGIAGFTARSKEIQIVVDAYEDLRFNSEFDLERGYRTKSVVAVPLINHNGEVLGVFQALNKKGGLFSSTDAQSLLLISNYATSAIENSNLYNTLKESQERVIAKLSRAAEFKDNETSEHTKRVALYAKLIATYHGMSQEDIELIEITSPMHDTGKIGIPDSILLKPGKLNNDEIVIMKTHATIGYDLLHDSDKTLDTAGIIAKEHHEKYDGSGYPKGLVGESINIFARITAIADVFDALTSKRPYKEAWSFEDAVLYLKEESAKHFDPNLIRIFLNHKDEVRDIYTRYKDTIA